MSIIDKAITNQEVIPSFQSNVFKGHQNSRFAAGMIAIGDNPLLGLDSEHDAFYQLRHNVYVLQTGQLGEDELQDDGTDRDIDDKRSVALGIVENCGDMQRLVACSRIIIKGFDSDPDAGRPLPVEEFCPDLFSQNPAPQKSIEVSRFIARYEKANLQSILSARMYASTLGYITNHELGPTYAIVEQWYERELRKNMPMERIGEPRYIPRYRDYNLPVQVFTDKYADLMRIAHPGLLEESHANEGRMSYFGKFVPPKNNPVETLQAIAS